MTERILINRILGLSRGAKQALMLVADILGLGACVWCAAWLLFADDLSAADIMPLAAATLVVAVLLARYQAAIYHILQRIIK